MCFSIIAVKGYCYSFCVICFGYGIIYYVVILSRGIAGHMLMGDFSSFLIGRQREG